MWVCVPTHTSITVALFFILLLSEKCPVACRLSLQIFQFEDEESIKPTIPLRLEQPRSEPGGCADTVTPPASLCRYTHHVPPAGPPRSGEGI